MDCPVQATLTHDPALAPASPSASEELSLLVRLAVPLAAANLGQTLIGAVDTAVVGRLGTVELGAAGLGNSVFFTVTVLGMGVMLGLDPLIAQAVGANEPTRARRTLWQGVWLALGLGFPLCVAVVLLGSLLERFGIDAATAEHTRDYVYARVWGLAPFLVFVALRGYLQAVSSTRPVVVAVVVANVINLPLSWALVFGDAGLTSLGLPALGVPRMGVAGAAWASTLCTLLQMAVLAVGVRRLTRGAEHGVRRPAAPLMKKALLLGTPIGLQLLAEFGVFSLVNVLMGNLDARSLAAHQVAITIASATFMVPVGIGAATSVRVGQAVGRADITGTRRAGVTGIAVGMAFMVCAATAFLLLPRLLAGIITDEIDVIEAVVPLLFVAAVFQLSDGVQAVAAGALRGAGDTRFPLLANLGGHYLVGLPLGVALGFGLGLGARGLWWGLSAGLTCVAVALALRFWHASSRPIARA